MNKRIFLGYVPYPLVKGLVKRMRGISGIFVKVFPDLPKTVKLLPGNWNALDYFGFGLITYSVYSLLFGLLISFVAYNSQNEALAGSYRIAFGLGFASFFAFLFLMLIILVIIPRSQAQNAAKDVDKVLLFALKDLVLQLSSGNTLYMALVNLSESHYGEVSRIFDVVARKINVGIPLPDAFSQAAETTDSDYLKRALFQMISSLRSGSDLRRTLSSIIDELNNDQKNQIMAYARELNLWSLFYMLFAVAVPTIGSTMLVILSSFAGFGVDQSTFIIFIIVCFIIQGLLVMFVKTRRPVVQF